MLRTLGLITFAGLVLLASAQARSAFAQPADDTIAPDATRSPALQSPEWRKTLQDFDEWASVQKIYDAAQIKDYRAKIVDKASRLSGTDLDDFQEDLNERLHVLLSDEARAARKWLGSTLAVASDSYAKEIKKKYADVAKMTASQLDEELTELEERQAGFKQYRAGIDANRKLEVDAAREKARRQDAANRAASAATPSSSYHPGYNYNANSNKSRGGGGPRYTPIPPVYSGGHSGLGGLGGFRW